MTSKLYIVYRITNIVERKHYYGYKACSKRDPKEIIGKTYFSSSSDKEFIEEQKNHPERFRYKIVARFDTKEEALEREILLHVLFDVGRNMSFYNRAKQTTTSFEYSGGSKGTTGKVVSEETRQKQRDAWKKKIESGWVSNSNGRGGGTKSKYPLFKPYTKQLRLWKYLPIKQRSIEDIINDRQKKSEATKNYYANKITDEERARKSERARNISEETRDKMRIAAKKRCEDRKNQRISTKQTESPKNSSEESNRTTEAN